MTMIRKQMQVVALLCGLAAGLPQAVAAPPAGPAHAHPTEGPHHGALIELGKEDYHAELVHDEKTDTITVYILDATARKPVPITAKELMLNLKAGNKPYQFPLAACRQAGEPVGAASAFAARGKNLCKALDSHGVSGRLNVEIGGKVYVGKVAGHPHDHKH